MKKLAVFGLDDTLLEAAREANRRNFPLVGIWSSHHDAALLTSLQLGCPAFFDAAEPYREAELVLWSEWPEGLGEPDARCVSATQGWSEALSAS